MNTESRYYEISYWLNISAEAETEEEKLLQLIKDKGVSVVSKSMPKKKRLAYPIEKQILGYLGSMYVETDPETIEALKKDLRVYKGLLRFIILSRKAVPSAHDVAKEQQEQDQDQSETPITPDEPVVVSEAQGE